ncbi:MAG: hypothetical protein NUW00_00290 [Candidatus Kaiserbacteria bacterium]|nr:hypothetical protein [Candidatus Kaiserbacteria bacterium]
MFRVHFGRFVLLVLCFLIISGVEVNAQTSCGSIIEIYGDTRYESLIEDCANPFGIVTENPNLKISYGTTQISEGGMYPFIGMVSAITLEGTHPEANRVMLSLYKTVPEGYERINENNNGEYTFTTSGTYTVVVSEDSLQMNQNILQKLFASVIPTAYAFPGVSAVITFTVTEPVEESTGASSILFLPGIMGSRLYEESDACGSSVKERERWVSSDECDQLRMETNVVGTSVYDIYTKTGDDSVVDETYTFNLYKSFITKLRDWKTEGVIADYATVPYDWRLRLDDLLKARLDSDTGRITYDVSGTLQDGYLYQTLAMLVASSTTGKVTIVTHSNGGLLAKTLLSALQNANDPLAGKVDALILVGVPQVGTPDAIVGMLHGTEIGPNGVILSQEMTRRLMSTMPFAYHLLPNQNYFSGQGSGVSTPALTFEDGDMTTVWKNTFGSTVTDENALHDFLRKESGRAIPSVDDLLTPAVVDGVQFQYARMIEQLQDEWTPPTTMNVYQIAGVGIETPTGITYFTDRECVSRNPLKLFECTQYEPKLGYRINFAREGDGTVVMPSALAMSDSVENVERKWLNLRSYNDDGVLGLENSNRVHKDIFEVDDVINFVKNTIQASSSVSYSYLGDTEPQLSAENRLIYYLHSPLDMFVTTQEGIVSSTTNTIRGATYRRYGEIQYISLPKSSGASQVLTLNGQSEGSFTLEVEEWGSGVMSERHTYSGIPSDTSTKVIMTVPDETPVEDAVLEVDYDGDGAQDTVYDTEGEIATVVTYDTLTEAIRTLSLKSVFKKPLLVMAKVAEKAHQKSLKRGKYKKHEMIALYVLRKQIELYERRGLISKTEGQNIVAIIDTLSKK